MFKFVQRTLFRAPGALQKRFFLSPAYYCEEVWENRLNTNILKQIKAEELYIDLEQRYSRTKTISAIDVDIFANSVTNDDLIDELIDSVHKLRLSADSSNTLPSTAHALIRNLIKYERYEDLLGILDDRLNYGIFVDDYEACLLLDTFWKKKDFLAGTRLAGQIMLQEDFSHSLVVNLCLLHIYNYLLKPSEWPSAQKAEEPEEDVKVRVKYLRNAFFDDHFDLNEPNKIIGKTLVMLTKEKKDSLDYSFHLLGLALYEKQEQLQKVINEAKSKNVKLCKEILDLLPKKDDAESPFANLQAESNTKLSELLENRVKQSERSDAEKDVSRQCEKFSEWENLRIKALEAQQTRINTAKRIANVDELQKALKDKETRLWFFENEEQIELAIEAKKVVPKRTYAGKKKKPRHLDEAYVPPEIIAKQPKSI